MTRVTFQILDFALLFALTALIFYILSLTHVLIVGELAYIFLCLAVISFIAWLLFRVFGLAKNSCVRGQQSAC